MAALVKIAAVAAAGFYRAGRFWPHDGVVIDPDTLEADALARLAAEPNLHIEPAPDGKTDAEAAQDDDALRARVRHAIAGLPAEAFGADDTPNLVPLRKALPADAKRITAELRDAIWAELKPAQPDQAATGGATDWPCRTPP